MDKFDEKIIGYESTKNILRQTGYSEKARNL